ncbi:hypothetical protein DC522_26740 [Microvirga sp. KLBC 81]|uniref:DUF6894 family protein n=1 Tax=Microvirga sp. KLBC 81 TaxID=1862707 RepID=UPI000D519084|nr:hypothetical protein [Microvirga sp. KLBC 81]PVE21423.1 hypothetical protein DC522_26740 [Microvirga sp. KLBC 81]
MPRFFFDTYDGETFIPDQEGLELGGLKEAEDQAARCLPDMAQDALPDSDRRDFVVAVRNESGETVLRAGLSLVIERLVQS